MSTALIIICIILAILQFLLFIRIWMMTDDVRELKNHFINNRNENPNKSSATSRLSTNKEQEDRIIKNIFGKR